ncbi:MAG: STAS domain-containing protein [Solirubrobacteraceae bacterium]
MSSPATVRCERRGDDVVVSLRGELDVFNAAEVTAAVASAVTPDTLGAVLDLTDVQFLDSSAVRQLFELAGRLVERRQRVHVVTPASSMVLRTLQLVEFSRAAPMHDTLEAALAQAGAE